MSFMHIFKRREYSVDKLHKDQLDANPLIEFKKWLRKAAKGNIKDSNAMVLSTTVCNEDISSRVVLLKEVNDLGIVFFTNYNSKKAKEIEKNSQVAVTFYWAELEKQVRIQGRAEKLNDTDNDNYFRSRDYGSQIASIVSPQSTEIESRHILVQRFKEMMYKNEPVSRPKDWGGYVIIPHLFEFWQGRKHRLNDRLEYFIEDGHWKIRRLAP